VIKQIGYNSVKAMHTIKIVKNINSL